MARASKTCPQCGRVFELSYFDNFLDSRDSKHTNRKITPSKYVTVWLAKKFYPTAGIYPRWDGNYVLGVLHHERFAGNERRGHVSPPSPSAPGPPGAVAEIWTAPPPPPIPSLGVVIGAKEHVPPPRSRQGRSRPTVGRRRSGPSRATRTPHDADVESRVRRI